MEFIKNLTILSNTDNKELIQNIISKYNKYNNDKTYKKSNYIEDIKKLISIKINKSDSVNKINNKIINYFQSINSNNNNNNNNNNNKEEDKEEEKNAEEFEEKYIINNNEILKDKIHEIHNYLRNSGAGYGMNALKLFSLVYGLKIISEKNLLKKLGLSEQCLYKNLLEMYDDELENTIRNICLNIHKNQPGFLAFPIPKHIKPKIYKYLIKTIDDLYNLEKESNFNLSGKIYEYFIGRDRSAISELGAYFTNRNIIKYILENHMYDLNINNKIIDPFAGTGGFLIEYIKILKTNNNINWSNYIQEKLYYNDANYDVLNYFKLEIFLLTSEIIIYNHDNFNIENSFTSEFQNKKFDIIMTNPPYGGDKIIKSNIYINNEKIINYIESLKNPNKYKKQLLYLRRINRNEKKEKEKHKVKSIYCSNRIKNFCKKYKLTKINDKESCSLILTMDLLNDNGTTYIVLKEGVFFDNKYSELRKCLIENFNITDIISIPQDQFENTTTKTSILIFKNTDNKTENINFYELIVEKYKEDKFEILPNKIILKEIKGEIKRVYNKKLIIINKKDILDKNKEYKKDSYSLNYKIYNYNTKIINLEHYNLLNIKDICELQKNIPNNLSEYKYYIDISCLGKDTILNFKNIKEYEKNYFIVSKNDILINSIRPLIPHHILILDNNIKYLHSNGLINLKCKDNKMIIYIYIYITLDIFRQILDKKTQGSVYPSLKNEDFLNIKIPIPKTKDKLNYWNNKFKIYYEIRDIKNKVNQIEDENINIIKNIINNNNNNKKYILLKNICELKDGYNFYTNEMSNNTQYIENYNLPIFNMNKNNYKYVIKNDNKYGKEYIIKKNDIIISITGVFNVKMLKLPQAYLNHGTLLVKDINKNINKYYLYYILKLLYNNNFIKKYAIGSIQSHIKIENIYNINIPIIDSENIKNVYNNINLLIKLEHLLDIKTYEYKEILKEFKNDIYNN